MSIATDLERTFSASIEELRDRLRERVGSLANDAFKKMTTQKEYRGLEINSNYGLSILDGAGRKVPLRSAGAEQVVALSLIDGLNRTGRGVVGTHRGDELLRERVRCSCRSHCWRSPRGCARTRPR